MKFQILAQCNKTGIDTCHHAVAYNRKLTLCTRKKNNASTKITMVKEIYNLHFIQSARYSP